MKPNEIIEFTTPIAIAVSSMCLVKHERAVTSNNIKGHVAAFTLSPML